MELSTFRSQHLSTPTWAPISSAIRLLLAVAGIIAVSAITAYLGLSLQWLVVGLLCAVAVIAITLARPFFGLVVSCIIIFAFEPIQNDPFMHVGWMLQWFISTWSPIRYINFFPDELLVIAIAVGVLSSALVQLKWPNFGALRWPLLIFTGLVLLSQIFGIITGGDVKASLAETRSFYLMAVLAFMIPTLARNARHLELLHTFIVLSTIFLSLEIIWRRQVFLAGITYLDNAFAHETPFLMNYVIVLILARFVWPSTKLQRAFILAVPLILYAEALTERRAGWIGLDIGLAILALATVRVRFKLFLYAVLPLAIAFLAYTVVFWNADPSHSIAQPARAVRSTVAPDQRDALSNLYRTVETADIRLNIRAHRLTGLGFGKSFTWYISPTALLQFGFSTDVTHNSFLWVWMKMGPLGFIGFLTLIGSGLAYGGYLLKQSAGDPHGPLLAAAVAGLAMILVYTYVDISLTNLRLTSMLGLVLGIIGGWHAYRSHEPGLEPPAKEELGPSSMAALSDTA